MLNFDSQGLIPVVIVDDATNTVLLVAFMNQEAYQLTRQTGQTHFYSRSRQKIWHKGEQSGNVQEVRAIFINCEENSLLIRVLQHGEAACHEGYLSCYYRRLLPDGSYETIAERIFDPETVYQTEKSNMDITAENSEESELFEEFENSESTDIIDEPDVVGVHTPLQLEQALRQLYDVYISLRTQDQSADSNTSRLLHEKDHAYLLERLSDELDELFGVQAGEHVHTGLQEDTALEGSQVGYWLSLLAAFHDVAYDSFNPHTAIVRGFTEKYTAEQAADLRQQCIQQLDTDESTQLIRGLLTGFSIVGWACASAGISPLAPIEYDLAQMRHKGLLR